MNPSSGKTPVPAAPHYRGTEATRPHGGCRDPWLPVGWTASGFPGGRLEFG